MMAILRMKEIVDLDDVALGKRLGELRLELNSERGLIARGGRASNSGRIRELRRTIARILTHQTMQMMMGKAPPVAPPTTVVTKAEAGVKPKLKKVRVKTPKIRAPPVKKKVRV